MEKLTQKDVIEKTWIKQVHVDEEGYFSDCPEFCDDCFWHDYFDVHTTPKIEEIKRLCNTFTVSSHKGKTYIYFAPNKDAIECLIKNCSKEIELARQQIIDGWIQESKEQAASELKRLRKQSEAA